MKIVITADDFGFTENVNRGIIDVYEAGRVTELSLMMDSYGTESAVKYIRDNCVKNVGLHFSLNRLKKDGKMLQGKDYDEILESWSTEKLKNSFDEEVDLFVSEVGYVPKHVIGHKMINVHPKLVHYVADFCVKNDCYARGVFEHETLQGYEIPEGLDVGRIVDRLLAFHYGGPKEMYEAYKKDIQKAKQAGVESFEIITHPGYGDVFEQKLTSFVQQRIDDVNFLMSDWFSKLVEEEGLELVSSDALV